MLFRQNDCNYPKLHWLTNYQRTRQSYELPLSTTNWYKEVCCGSKKKKEEILPGPGCNKVFAVVIVADAPLYAYAKYLSAAGKEQSKASKHTRQESSRPAHTCTQLAVPPTHQPTPPAFSTFSGPHQTI